MLGTLLARNGAAGAAALSTASDAQQFFEALYSEEQYNIVVIDDRPRWADWHAVAAASRKYRPYALVVLLVSVEHTVEQCEHLLGDDVAAVYPRNSAGMLALARLLATLSSQQRHFSLRRDATAVEVDAEEVVREEREKLIYAVSHDLQDPLQLARRYAGILTDDYENALGDDGTKVLDHLQFNLNRTQEMLDELLDYSRLQSARPEKTPVDMNELLSEVVSLYRLTLDEIGGSVTQQHALPTLVVDRRQMLRVMQNLIGNAIKFRSERPLQVTVRAQKVRNEWRIGVKDNGIGIADDDTKRIFGMFERAGGADEHPGTGMGLAICKRIIANHGGKIWVRSSPGSGSVFIFSIPQTDDAASSPPHD